MITTHTIARSRRLLCRNLIVAFIGFILPLSLVHGATETVTKHPNTAYALALKYLTAHADTTVKTTDDLAKEDDFKKFLADQGLKADGKMAGSVATLVVNLATAANDEGIVADPSKPAFQALVQEAAAQKLNVSVATLQGAATPAAAGGGKAASPEQPAGDKPATAATGGDKPATANDVTAIVNAAIKNDTAADFSRIQSYFHAGVTLINPYHLDTTKTPLTIAPASTTDVNAFLEFVYTNRWAWNEQRRNNVIPLNPSKDESQVVHIFSKDKFTNVLGELDLKGMVGYTFSSGSSPSANTLAGSGNFNAQVSLEIPFVLFRAQGDDSAFSVGPEASVSAVTERANLRVHPSSFYGLSYSTSFKDPFGTKEPASLQDAGQPLAGGNKSAVKTRRVLVHFGLGWAHVDSVRYVSDAGNEIFSINNNLPKYFSTHTKAFETELLYPVKNSTYITFTSQVYPELNPGLWNIQIGVTTSFADLMNTFFK